MVLVLTNGSALAVNWADEHVPAILEAWYPGESGGKAVAEALAGDLSPAGRLPVTFYKSVEQLPDSPQASQAPENWLTQSGSAAPQPQSQPSPVP